MTKRRVGAEDGPQQRQAISQVHLGGARLLVSEAKLLVSVGARWHCDGHSDMEQAVSVDLVLQLGPTGVEAKRGGFQEDGGSRDLKRGVVKERACIVLIGSAGGLEQDVFSPSDGSQGPLGAHGDVEGDVDGIDHGVLDEAWARR